METWAAVRSTRGVGRGLLGEGLFGEREELSFQEWGKQRHEAGEREAAEALGRGKL